MEFTDVMTDPAAGTVLLDTETSLVPKKPDIMPETLNLNLSEFVVVRFIPPRILSGFASVQDFYTRYLSPLEETCSITVSGDGLESLR